jgi:putative acetyltransferase
VIVRAAGPADHMAIREILLAAFQGPDEADLVEQLRADGDAAIELVAEQDKRIVGHILFSRVEAPFRALALAPVAVAPERQRQGVGSALIRAGHERARAHRCAAIFVLGDPAYYTRLGYSLEAAAPFTSPYSGSHFMALALAQLPATGGEIRYARAFSALEEE